uniref:trypsin n=1 Tax=Myripristis murdjan TaxID=586833 RepID=A0A668ARJ0_9TELE
MFHYFQCIPGRCNPNPCLNNGVCEEKGKKNFKCDCPKPFKGRKCEKDDCYEDNGESYRGNVSETDDGKECLYWNSHFILEKGVNPFSSFEDEDGLGPHNFCRNPDGDMMPWCFFRRGRKLLWDYCDVTECPDEAPSTSAKPTAAQPTSNATAALEQFSTCGKPQPKKPITRIYGGLKAIPGAQPWQVSLQVRPKGSNQLYRHICGGVLIKSCWVLTIHILYNTKHEFIDMQVVLGGLTLNSEEPTEQTLQVEEAIKHEDYRETPSAVYNDIALLRLKGSNGVCAHETQFVKTACLPDAPLNDGTECTISGWGATENSSYGSNHLLDAKVMLISQEKCSEAKIYGSVLDDTMFCAGYLQGGVDSCQGDSGGPLTCDQNSTHVIYGLVSWGDQCGRKNKPGVYTRVTHFLDWIKSKTETNGCVIKLCL